MREPDPRRESPRPRWAPLPPLGDPSVFMSLTFRVNASMGATFDVGCGGCGGAGTFCGLSLAIAAATASLACRDAASMAAWVWAGFGGALPGREERGPLVPVDAGGIKDFWLTCIGTAGFVCLFFRPGGGARATVIPTAVLADVAGGAVPVAVVSVEEGFVASDIVTDSVSCGPGVPVLLADFSGAGNSDVGSLGWVWREWGPGSASWGG